MLDWQLQANMHADKLLLWQYHIVISNKINEIKDLWVTKKINGTKLSESSLKQKGFISLACKMCHDKISKAPDPEELILRLQKFKAKEILQMPFLRLRDLLKS